MSELVTRATVVRAFLHLRPNGVSLGIGELLAAIKLLNEGFVDPQKPELVLRTLRKLWCKSEADEWHLQRIWHATRDEQGQMGASAQTDRHASDHSPLNNLDPNVIQATDDETAGQQSDGNVPELSFLPFKPPIALAPDVPAVALQTYWPVSRRFMAYIWRYLRRPAYGGTKDRIDLAGTIETVARTGLFIEPIYQRREINSARLLLLLDHRGSMMPFHRYLRDMVETLRESAIALENQAVYYFENVPGQALFQTPYLTKPVEKTELLRFIDHATGVLIVSDAGAARGRPRNRLRVRSTFDFLFDLYERTRFVVWLNPMPAARWAETSAEAIASTVPMFPMDEHGFSGAIDILSGRAASRQGSE